MYILIILILGLLMRLISLNQSLWLDEATTALASKMSLTNLFTKFLPGDFHPPLYYLVMKYWATIFGYSEISLRIPSLIFGLGTVYLMYLICKRFFDKKAGIIASLLMSTSGLAIYYSQEARMYAMAMFLVTASIYLFLKRKWMFFSIILMLIGLTDYISLFIIPVFFIIDWKSWKKILLSFIPATIAFVLWLPVFIKQIGSGMSVKSSNWWNILGLPTVKNLVLIPVKFVFGRISFDDKIAYGLVVVAVFLFFSFLLYSSFKNSNILRRPLRGHPYKVLITWLIVPIVLGYVISFKIPTLLYFRYLFCLSAFYLLIANWVAGIKKISKMVVILLLAFNLITSGYYLCNPRFHREDWRSLVSFIESKKDATSITVFPANSNMEAYLYYAPNGKISGPEGIRTGYSQIWLMDYLSSVFDPDGLSKSKVEALGYKEESIYTFNGIGPVYLYKK